MEINKEYYYEYLLSDKWKAKRLELFALRGKKCEKCGSNVCIQVHHLNYNSIFNERNEDLQILCKKCHDKLHPHKKKKKKKPTIKPTQKLKVKRNKSVGKAQRKKNMAAYLRERKRKMGY